MQVYSNIVCVPTDICTTVNTLQHTSSNFKPAETTASLPTITNASLGQTSDKETRLSNEHDDNSPCYC